MSNIIQFNLKGDNREGVLADIIQHLGYGAVNIRSIMISNQGKHGELRLVVDDPVKTERIFKEVGLSYSTEEVIAIKMPDKPGALHHVATILAQNNINIEYIYPLLSTTHNASIVFKTHNIERTQEVLENNNIKTSDQNDI